MSKYPCWTSQHWQKFWSRILARLVTSYFLKYLTLQTEISMRTAAAPSGIYEFWALDIEKVWNKRLYFHFISLLFIWTHMCIIQSRGKHERLHWERLSYVCSSEVFTQRINPSPQNWKDLKLDVETADTKIFSREGEKVWNKLPTNDRAIVRRASWQPAFARVNLN